MRITIKGLINEGLPPANNFYPQKRERKKKRRKKRIYSSNSQRAAAVKVFGQNTTRSVARCGDCAQNP
jgi:hypothetical protein